MNPQFSMENADQVIGRIVIVQLESRDAAEKILHRKELVGRIIRISEGEGLVLSLFPDGVEFRLPPDLSSLETLPPGPYHLQSTGQTVENAELLINTTIHQPPPEMDVPPVQELPGQHPKLER